MRNGKLENGAKRGATFEHMAAPATVARSATTDPSRATLAAKRAVPLPDGATQIPKPPGARV